MWDEFDPFRVERSEFPHHLSMEFSPFLSDSTPDFPGCPQDPSDAAARGEGLHQLFILRDQAERV